MTRTLPALQVDAVCVKCGGEEISMRYGGPDDKCLSTSHCFPWYYDKPHVHRNCRRCGFHWLEKPAKVGQETREPAQDYDFERARLEAEFEPSVDSLSPEEVEYEQALAQAEREEVEYEQALAQAEREEEEARRLSPEGEEE